MSDIVSIPKEEYDELVRKAAAYDKYSEVQRKKVQKANASMTPEQRSANARKAALARIAKYGQKRRTE